ncbi:MAG: hypothetical protein V1820_02590 [archaeon]
MLKFNENVRLIICDVDDTAAKVYLKSEKRLVAQFEKLLSEGKALFFISGQGRDGIHERITSQIRPALRKRTLLGTCLGAEVWGFDGNGELEKQPVYTLYEKMSGRRRKNWRELVGQLIEEFELKRYPLTPVSEFRKAAGITNPNAIMLADRGAQITFELVNDAKHSLRGKMRARANSLLGKNRIPVEATFGGTFALDLRLKGASKEEAVRRVVRSEKLLARLGLSRKEISPAEERIEIWGDRFELGLPDAEVCLALPKAVRAIDFRREENPSKFPKGHKIVFWDGKKQLDEGLLEYLDSRKNAG